MKCRNYLFSIIMSIITFIVGLFGAFMCMGDTLKVRLIMFFFSFFPFLLFCLLIWYGVDFSDKPRTKKLVRVSSIVITLCLFGYYLFVLFFGAALESTNPVYDIRTYRYHVSRNDWLLQVFPKSIPDDVTDVHFRYSPGFLQGGTEVNLYYIDEDLDFVEMDEFYREKAIKIESMRLRSSIEEAFLDVKLKNGREEFTVYKFEDRCDGSGYCNHGSTLLVGINKETKEFFYRGAYW